MIQTVNNSVNSSMSPRYIFGLPIEERIKIAWCSVEGLAAFIGFLANALVLYFMRRGRAQRKRSLNRTVTSTFVQSLSLSNLLCCLVSFPITITGTFVDIYNTDAKCKSARFFNISFAIVTVANILVLGIERYLAVFYPLKVPTPSTIKLLVIAAWVVGAALTIIPAVIFTPQKVWITTDTVYTYICRGNNDVPVYRALFTVFSIIVYIVPCVVLVFINVRIIKHMKQRNKKFDENQVGTRASKPATNYIVTIIFIFIIPYFLSFLLALVRMSSSLNFTVATDLIFRRVSSLISYSNTMVSPIFMLFRLPELKRQIRKLLGRTEKRNTQPQTRLDMLSKNKAVGPRENVKSSSILPITSSDSDLTKRKDLQDIEQRFSTEAATSRKTATREKDEKDNKAKQTPLDLHIEQSKESKTMKYSNEIQ